MEQETLYGQRVVGYRVNPKRSVNLDTLDDWARAEAWVEKGA